VAAVSLTQHGTPLSVLLRALDAAQTAQAPVARALAKSAAELALEGYDAARSPAGIAWAPIKRPRPGSRPLVRTRALRESATQPYVYPEGFIFVSTPWGSHHQLGAPRANIPARPFWPTTDLPSRWAARMADEAERALARHLHIA
jgi:phage gpG-like protein